MITFVVGTTAELIKIAPVYHELGVRGRPSEIWYTGQHVVELPGVLADLDLPEPAVWLVPREGAANLARSSGSLGPSSHVGALCVHGCAPTERGLWFSCTVTRSPLSSAR